MINVILFYLAKLSFSIHSLKISVDRQQLSAHFTKSCISKNIIISQLCNINQF